MNEYNCPKQCGNCCKEFYLALAKEGEQDVDWVRWIADHERCKVIFKNGICYLKLDLACRHLNKDGQCSIYGQRPLVCRKYNCETSDL